MKLKFDKINYIILVIGALLIIAGYSCMSGKGSSLTAFNPDIFSRIRIDVAPLLCLLGYLVNILGLIYRRQKKVNQ